jgi:hypothetical protein
MPLASILTPTPEATIALIVAVSFAAGLNVPATTLTLGLLARTGVVELPSSLMILSDWWVLGAGAALFAVELVTDKIPVFDLVWNALQTFIRVPAGALLAYASAVHLSPGQQLLATALGAVLALLAHAGKTAARVAVTLSPEMFSNVALSLGEDALAIFITWFATSHPFLAAALVVTFLVVMIVLVRFVMRGFRYLFLRRPRHLQPRSV